MVFAAKMQRFVTPIAPNCPVRSDSLLKLRYVTHSRFCRIWSNPTGAAP